MFDTIDPTTLTLALLLTTAGATAAAAFITGLVAVLRQLAPDAIDGREKQVAALTSAILVVLLAVAALTTDTMVFGIQLILAIVFAWYAVTRLSMSIYDDLTSQPGGLRGSDSAPRVE